MTRCALLALLLVIPFDGAAAEEDSLSALRHALKRGDLVHAVELGERAVAASPSSSEAHHWLGKAYGTKAKHAAVFTQVSLAKKCRAELARAVELDPGNLPAALDLVRYDARAPHMLGGGRDKARALAEEIGRARASRGHVARGLVYEAEKNLAAAEGAYRAALAADPGDGEALSALADFLTSRRRYDEAYAACRAAADRAPEDAHPWFEIGLISVSSRRDLERGIEALDRFLSLPAPAGGPEPSDARYRKGELLALMGDTSAARAELAQALALEPGHAGATEAIARLSAARRNPAPGS